jgi:hypothetical protein
MTKKKGDFFKTTPFALAVISTGLHNRARARPYLRTPEHSRSYP